MSVYLHQFDEDIPCWYIFIKLVGCNVAIIMIIQLYPSRKRGKYICSYRQTINIAMLLSLVDSNVKIIDIIFER